MSAPVTVSVTRHVDPSRTTEMLAWVQAGTSLAESNRIGRIVDLFSIQIINSCSSFSFLCKNLLLYKLTLPTAID